MNMFDDLMNAVEPSIDGDQAEKSEQKSLELEGENPLAEEESVPEDDRGGD